MAKTTSTINWNDAESFLRAVQKTLKSLGIEISTSDLHLFTGAKFVFGAGKGKDVILTERLNADEQGYNLTEAKDRARSNGINAIGVKGGVEVAPGIFTADVDADFKGVKLFLENQNPKIAATFSTLGSKPEAGHLFFLTDKKMENTSPMFEKHEAIGLAGAGRHVFDFCLHRNGKTVYTIERSEQVSFISSSELLEAVAAAVKHFGFSWVQRQPKQGKPEQMPQTNPEGIKKLIQLAAKDQKLADLLAGNPNSQDRSGDDFALAGKCAFYEISENEAALILQKYGSSKAQERGSRYIDMTVSRAYAGKTNSQNSLTTNSVNSNDVGGVNSQNTLSTSLSTNGTVTLFTNPLVVNSVTSATVKPAKFYAGFPFSEIRPEDLIPPAFLAAPYIPKNHITLICGAPKGYKTTFTVHYATRIAIGALTWSGHPTIAQKVGYFDLEDSLPHIVKSINAHTAFFSAEEKVLLGQNFVLFSQPACFKLKDYSMLRETILKYGLQVVIVDTLRRALDGDENNSEVISQMYNDVLAPAIKEFGVSFILLHHNRKPNPKTREQEGSDFSSIRGSGDLFAMAGSTVMLDRLRKKNEVYVHHVGSKWSTEALSHHLKIEENDTSINFIDLGEVEESAGAVQARVLAILEYLIKQTRREGITTKELIGQFGKGYVTDDAIKQLKAERKLVGSGEKNRSPFRLVLREPSGGLDDYSEQPQPGAEGAA